MYIIKARKGSFTFTLSALGFYPDTLSSPYPPSTFSPNDASLKAFELAHANIYDDVWAEEAPAA